jgi:hypothetical protein
MPASFLNYAKMPNMHHDYPMAMLAKHGGGLMNVLECRLGIQHRYQL